MKSAENLKKSIKRLHVAAKPELHDRVLGGLLKRMEESVNQPSAITEPNIWRMIMKSNYTKIAAAIILVATILGVYIFHIPPDGAKIAWAQMNRELQNVKWMHTISVIETSTEKKTSQSWACYDPHIFAAKGSHRGTQLIDYENGQEYHYNAHDPYTNEITILPITEIHPNSPERLDTNPVKDILEHFIDDEAAITREVKTIANKEVEVIGAEVERHQVTLYRDLEQNRLIRMDTTFSIEKRPLDSLLSKARSKESVSEDTQQPIIETFTCTYNFDYTNNGPKDIYELGVPETAEIVNYCPEGQLSDIMAIVSEYVFRNYGDHIAIVLESNITDDDKLEPSTVTIMRQKGIDQRLDQYNADNKDSFESIYLTLKDDWPNLSIDQVIQSERAEARKYKQITDNNRNAIYKVSGKSQDKVNVRPGMNVRPWHGGMCMATIAWCDQYDFTLNRHTFKVIEYEMLPSDAQHENLIGFRVSKTQPSPLRTEIYEYWLDPSKDYILMECVKYRNHANYYWDSKKRTITLDTNQTADGQWYPSHIVYTWEHTDKNGAHRERTDKRIIVDTTYAFPESIFDVDDLRKTFK